MQDTAPARAAREGSAPEVFATFLRLGLTSFGGPIAHLGYFRAEFVERRRWLDDSRFSQLLALSQFLPGPASSQLGFAIGLQRTGWLGGVAAFAGFTLPSALLLFALALVGASLGASWWLTTVHGLKLVAVIVVADGLWRMARQLTPDVPRIFIAAAAAGVMLSESGAGTQMLALGIGGAVGLLLARRAQSVPARVETAAQREAPLARGLPALVAFASLLLVALSIRSAAPSLVALASAFVRAGSLVFGGGHVVLPLLEGSVVANGWLTQDQFLTGYGAAQAVPGPMFSLAAYLGALVPWAGAAPSAETAALGATIALLAVFTPGFLLVGAVLPVWDRLVASSTATGIIAGVNAAVVGLLAAALYDPVILAGVTAWPDVAIVLAGLVLQRWVKRPALWTVLYCVGAAALLSAL